MATWYIGAISRKMPASTKIDRIVANSVVAAGREDLLVGDEVAGRRRPTRG